MNKKSTVEELLTNDDFIKLVKENQGCPEWTLEQKEFTYPIEDIELARVIVEQINKPVAKAVLKNDKDEVWNKLESATKHSNHKPILIKSGLSLILISILSLAFYYYFSSANSNSTDMTLGNSVQWAEYTNTTNSNWPLDLSDGSQVILEPKATLKYPRLFNQKSRKVELIGDAFFNISHDTLKPFYVYANDAVVRVLGTSFHVKADEDDKDIQVIVKTGKVAVYKGKEIKQFQSNEIQNIKPLLVTPNQIGILNKSNLKFNKRLVSRPTLTKPLESIEKIHFENQTIHEIAEALEDAYGIDIEIDSSIGTTCRLTTTLTNQPLFEKLKIICDPLGLKYLEKDLRIHITGNCQ